MMLAEQQYNILGIMSGSSLDGLDLAFCQIQQNNSRLSWKLYQAETIPYPLKWKVRLSRLTQQNALNFAKTHTYYGHYIGELVNTFINKHKIEPDFIASHGHTIFHDPMARLTVQIGDGAALAATTGYPVINNFRNHDIAINGEGTPIAPIADKLLFPNFDFYLNIGGIANISCNLGDKFIAFDICPANQVLNRLAQELDLEYDKDGERARQGLINTTLLEQVEEHNFFVAPYPKSLSNQWILKEILPIYFNFETSIPDKLATATKHIAKQIHLAIEQIIEKEQFNKQYYTLFITGGGAFNKYLIELIEQTDLPVKIQIPSSEIIAYKEALLMALMGFLRVSNQVNCLSSVTGASFDTIGGAIYQGITKKI